MYQNNNIFVYFQRKIYCGMTMIIPDEIIQKTLLIEKATFIILLYSLFLNEN